MFRINEIEWNLRLVEPYSDMLRRSDNVITLGVTDANVNTVYINNRLSGAMLEKVICHELVHCFSFSYSLHIPIETEEIVADFLATYGRDVFAVADDVLKKNCEGSIMVKFDFEKYKKENPDICIGMSKEQEENLKNALSSFTGFMNAIWKAKEIKNDNRTTS